MSDVERIERDPDTGREVVVIENPGRPDPAWDNR